MNSATDTKKKWAIFAVKMTLVAAILGYLFYQAAENDAFSQLASCDKNWGMLFGAWLLCIFAVMITIVRWFILARAIGIPLRFAESVQIGFLGFLFNLAPMGIVGGDVVKAVMLGRHHEMYAQSFASVLVDRVIGLYVLFLVAVFFFYATGMNLIESDLLWYARYAMISLAAIGTVGMIFVMAPDLSGGATTQWIQRIPKIGPKLMKLTHEVQMYQKCPAAMLIALVMSVCVHCTFAIALYMIASGLYAGQHPSLSHHMAVSPVSFATGAIPLPLGPFEAVLDSIYPCLPASNSTSETPTIILAGQGLVVALCYRIITVLIAAIGGIYYLTSRDEVTQVFHDMEDEEAKSSDANC